MVPGFLDVLHLVMTSAILIFVVSNSGCFYKKKCNKNNWTTTNWALTADDGYTDHFIVPVCSNRITKIEITLVKNQLKTTIIKKGVCQLKS